METKEKWITPFIRQCFVVLGASINLSQIGFMFGYVFCLLPQLQNSTTIPLDDTTASWVAAIPGLSQVLGNLAVSPLMVKFGRRKANLISILFAIAGWACLAAASSLIAMMIGRALQGISGGLSICLVPILVGEYTSPKNRGAFTTLVCLILGTGTLTAQLIGFYLPWRIAAIVITAIFIFDFVMVLFSPESPYWLADHGMYADCERSFRWLRGNEEDDELAKIIETSKISRQVSGARFHLSVMLKREFYLPLIISFHLYMLSHYGGIYVFATYIVNFVDIVVDRDVDIGLVLICVGVTRMVACVIAVFIIRRVKRRTMLFIAIGVNCLVLFAIAGYVYAKDMTQCGNPAAGYVLLFLFMVSVSMGSIPVPLTVLGEIFPLKFKGITVGVSSIIGSLSTFLCVKTYPFLEKQLGLHGAYCIYCCILVYALAVLWFILPETKDKTLQEIEGKFRREVVNDLRTVQPLTLHKE